MDQKKLESVVDKAIQDFYTSRFRALDNLTLAKMLKRKNPYLYKAIGIETPEDMIEDLMRNFLSASDETIFGSVFFEAVARAIPGVQVSDGEGIDFFIVKGDSYLGISLKSGPNVFNASQKKRMNDEFTAARSRLATKYKHFDALLGHGYGQYNTDSPKKIYRDRSGQAFWQEITGDPDFHVKMIRAIVNAPIHRSEYQKRWKQTVDRLKKDFVIQFCIAGTNEIDWEKLARYVSDIPTK